MDALTFRKVAGPQFADQIAYPPEAVQFWIDQAAGQLNTPRWGTMLDQGVMLYVAHNLAVTAAAGTSGAAGPVSSKSVGGVSIAYNTAAGAMEAAGPWNLTTYGQRFYKLAQMIGIGGIQL